MQPQEIADKLGLKEFQLLDDIYDMMAYDNRNSCVCDSDGHVIGLNVCKNELPSEKVTFLWNLKELQALNLSENTLRHISIPKGLDKLVYLNLSENKELKSIELEGGMKALKDLDISECALESVTFPEGFESLDKLFLQKNKLKSVHFEAASSSLRLLDLGNNELATFTLPEGFDGLRFLYLANNQLERLDFKIELKKLDTLGLKNNQFKIIPLDFLKPYPELQSLYLQGNPLSTLFRGFIENDEYKSCLEDMQRTIRELEKGREKDVESKVLLIGNGNVGKSCLVARLIHDKFEEKWKSTHAISLSQYLNKPYLLNIWDFGGQDIYHATHRLFMQSDSVYLVLWDAVTEQSEKTPPIEEYGEMRQYDVHDLWYWMAYAKNLGKDSPVIVVQTKFGRDGRKDKPKLRDFYAPQLSFLNFQHIESSEDDWDENGYTDLMTSVRRAVKKTKPNQEIPSNYAEMRRWLRQKQLLNEKRLTFEDYKQKAVELDIEDPGDVLENWLVKTGVVFYKEGLFHNEIILDQEWAIEAIYTIFNRNDFYYDALQNKNGQFSGKDLAKIWRENTEAERELFVSFMLSCKMCFEVGDKKKEEDRSKSFEERVFVAPQLLQEEKPQSIEDIWLGRDAYYLRYHYDFLHYGVIQSFIVSTQELAEIRDIWRMGISLKEENQLALVEARKKEKEILVRVSRNGKPLMDKIRNLLEQLEDQKGVESVSLDGKSYVGIQALEENPKDNPKIKADNGEEVLVRDLAIFLQRDKNASFEKDKEEYGLGRIPEEIMNKRGLISRKIDKTEEQKAEIFLKKLEPVVPKTLPHPTKEQPWRIFLFEANTKDQRHLNTAREIKFLHNEMQSGSDRECYKLNFPGMETTYDGLMRLLSKFKPNIIHFSGHGEPKGIVLANENGESEELSLMALLELFDNFRDYAQLIILNACHSSDLAKYISRLGIFVIGNENPIPDNIAITFSQGFYMAISEGFPIKRAYKLGRTKVRKTI